MPSRRVRQHVNPLRSEFFTIALEALPLPPPGVPIEVELGSAEAHYLIERARAAPAGFYVGVELRVEIVKKAKRACAKLGLAGRVHNLYANMMVDLPRLFPDGRVSRFFLNFPDPWWKSKQQKRRVAEAPLVDAIFRALAPGGELFVATDIFEIALEMMALLEGEGAERFVNVAGPWSFLKEAPFAARSRREKQCVTEGAAIWRLGFRKPGAPSLTTE